MLLDLIALADVPPPAVETLLDAAFGADRHRRTAYRLRAGMTAIAELSFAVRDGDGALAGVLQSWPVQLAVPEGRAVPLVLVGPVAVAPARQGAGIGRALMDRLLVAAAGREPLVLIGDPEYYGRFFGFAAAPTAGWMLPGPVERHRLLVRSAGVALPPVGSLEPRR